MPKIIVTSRYLKSGSKKKLKNYVKYIATREGSVPTVSERENYVGYLANRPNSHGLFNEKDDPINLEKTAKEIADHGGNVWTHVVSLRRDDAQAMGYDNLTAWRELVKRQIPSIAKNQKIDLKNLRWYAAFHDKKTNPHVHIIVYSTNEREGFLTNHGIEKIRSGFANDIYADELHHIYEQQTDLRNLLKKESEQLMKQLAEKISQNNNFDSELMNLVAKLRNQLSESKGKKVYGYLKPDVKKTVDEIFARLADNDSVKKMYDLWCEMEQQKHDVYSSARVDFPLLIDNKEFRSVKNMIIQTVLEMDFPTFDMEIEIPEPAEINWDTTSQIDEALIDSVEDSPQNRLYIKCSDSYKEAHKLILSKESILYDYQKAEKILMSESNNVLALHDLEKLYSMEKSGLKNDKKSFKFYEKALQEFIQIEPKAKKIKPYLQYQIGMMYFKGLGTPIDNKKAVEYFEKSAELGNQYAKRLLAFEYINGKNFTQNIEKGISLLNEFANSGDAFSCYQLGKIYLAEEKYDIQKAISYFEKSADKNMQSSYQLGRLYLFGSEDLEKDQEKAMHFLNQSAEQGNEYAQYIIDNTEKFESEMLANTVFSLFVNLSRCIEDDYHRNFQSGRKMIDSKLQRVIQEKKQYLGIKQEHGQVQEY